MVREVSLCFQATGVFEAEINLLMSKSWLTSQVAFEMRVHCFAIAFEQLEKYFDKPQLVL